MKQAEQRLEQRTDTWISPSAWLRVAPGVLGLLLFVLALAPAIIAPGDFWTPDEAKHWSVRAEVFRAALQRGTYAETNLVGHPGVTTMWLGAVGAQVYQLLADQGWVVPATPALDAILDGDYGRAVRVYQAAPTDFTFYRWLLRLPVALVNAFGVAVSFWLLRRLFDVRVALVAALLMATDPFLIAHGKVLHVDALLTTFVTLSLLSAMLALGFGAATPDRRSWINWPLLVVSAVLGGLALLTKSPSVVLVPMVGVIGLVGFWWVYAHQSGSASSVRSGLRLLAALLLWGVLAMLVWLALWPAAWVDAGGAIWTVVREVSSNGAQPHSWGNFFLGQVVGDPGPLYYPVALVLRLTPWVLVGLLALGGAVLWRQGERAVLDRRQVLVASLLAGFVLFFLVLMSVPAKKFDRYILPIFPLVNTLAAIGLVWLFVVVRDRLRLWQPTQWVIGVVFSVLLIINLWWYQPFQLAYYNPLLGGGQMAVETMYVGWGEGLEQAGQYIAAQPDGCDHAVGSWYELVILPYVCSAVMDLSWSHVPGHVDYVVLYVNQLQRQIKTDVTELVLQHGSLVHTVQIHGIDYAFVYQLPRPNAYTIDATFGDRVGLVGYDVDTTPLQTTGMISLTLQWQVRAPMRDDYRLFLHVLNDQGERVGQADTLPGGPDRPTSSWSLHHFVTWFHPIPLPVDLPAGRYWLAVGIYDAETGQRLALHGPVPDSAPDDGADALIVAPFLLP
ncbi:MAG: phospholipid carrier-dependent glycosyltransferase [Chloroflexaceae bacterium]|nr:phospholipid carrier-dependent glycosyltransferase [Chloroflexaceae bacterium]